jgi:hypothetical protein
VSPPYHLPKVDARFRERDAMNNALHDVWLRRFQPH